MVCCRVILSKVFYTVKRTRNKLEERYRLAFKVVQYCWTLRKIYENILGNYEMWCSRWKETIIRTGRVISEEMLRWSQRGKERPTYNEMKEG
jgi:hypothetical protein